MVKTFRSSKVMKFVDQLSLLRQAEDDHTVIFGNRLKEQFPDFFDDNEASEDDVIDTIIDIIIEQSYAKGGIDFSHSQLSLFHETMFHLGAANIVDNIIKEMGDFFDLDIPEIKKSKSDLENYKIKSIDTSDYSTTPREFYIIVGGLDESCSEKVQTECANQCLRVLLGFLKTSDVRRVDKGFIIQTALQSIPNISMRMMENHIGIYGIIPVEEKDSN